MHPAMSAVRRVEKSVNSPNSIDCVRGPEQVSGFGRAIALKPDPMKNALTIDLEDYYQVTAFANGSPQNWDSQVSRVEANTERVLELLAGAKRSATFFTLGWVAEKYPRLVRQVAESGHEIACHSHLHRLVYSLSPAEFRDDTRRAKEVLEQASGNAVRGYRAPSFSITRDAHWALEILAELGFSYDSSIFPVKHLNYGMPGGPRFPFRIQTPAGPIVEFPMPTLALGGATAPFGGGAYFRLLPYGYTRWGIRYLNQVAKQPVCVFLHPWEIDTQQPRMAGSISARARHYFGLGRTEAKLKRLLAEVEFCTLGALIAALDLSQGKIPH
jgi:polysaccharide deacetylase family protein (PEP-CTERM system associated)